MNAWEAKQLTIETHKDSTEIQLENVYEKIADSIKENPNMVIVHTELLNEQTVQHLQEVDGYDVQFNSKINDPKYTIGWYAAKEK